VSSRRSRRPLYRGAGRPIEVAWQDRWSGRDISRAQSGRPAVWMDRAGQGPAEAVRGWTCFPTPRRRLHAGNPLVISAPTSTPLQAGWTAAMCCTPWVSTHSGLPAEQYAVQTGQHPRVTTEANIENIPRPAASAGHGSRPAPFRVHHRPGLLPLDAVDFSCRSSIPGTTPTPTRPALLTSWSPSWTPALAFQVTAPIRSVVSGRICPKWSAGR